jgi:hypothetical protein
VIQVPAQDVLALCSVHRREDRHATGGALP